MFRVERWLELCHLDGYYGALVAFVAQTSTCTVHCLLHILCSQQSEDNGNVVGGIQASDTLRNTLTDVVKVRRFTTDNTSQHDNCIVTIVQCHLTGSVNQLERTGNRLYVNVLRQSAMLFKSRDTAVKQCSCDFRIPFSHHNAENQAELYSDRFLVAIAYFADARSMYLSMV